MKIRQSFIIKNSLFNLFGEGIPSLMAIIALPFLINRLGDERFGLFMLIWAIQGYMQFLSFRLGVALVKFGSESIGKGEDERLPYLTWTTTLLLGCLGAIGGLVLVIFALFPFTQIFTIPAQLSSEAKIALFLTALSIPFNIVSIGFKALLQAYQRFDLVNLVHGAGGCLRYLIALCIAEMGFHLPPIVLALFIIDVLRLLAYLLLCFKLCPLLKSMVINIRGAKPLLWYGSWLSISHIVATLIQYVDRFLVGALLPIAQLTYYATPVEIINRLGMISQSVNRALFPSLSILGKDAQGLQLYAKTIRNMLISVAPISFLLMFMGQDILRLYLGEDIAVKTSFVLRLLALGFLFQVMGSIIHNYVLALGYPNAVGKFHLIELPVYIGLSYCLINKMGIEGMALAWFIRQIIEASYVFLILQRAAPQNIHALTSNGIGRAITITMVLALFIATAYWVIPQSLMIWTTILLGLIAYGVLVFNNVLTFNERKSLLSMIKGINFGSIVNKDSR